MQLNCFPCSTKITAKCRSLCFTGIPVFFASSFWAKLTRKPSRSDLFPPRPAWQGTPAQRLAPIQRGDFDQPRCTAPGQTPQWLSPSNPRPATPRARALYLLMSTSDSELPGARIESPGTGPRIESGGKRASRYPGETGRGREACVGRKPCCAT